MLKVRNGKKPSIRTKEIQRKRSDLLVPPSIHGCSCTHPLFALLLRKEISTCVVPANDNLYHETSVSSATMLSLIIDLLFRPRIFRTIPLTKERTHTRGTMMYVAVHQTVYYAALLISSHRCETQSRDSGTILSRRKAALPCSASPTRQPLLRSTPRHSLPDPLNT